MTLGRNKCVIGDMTPKKAMPHEEFVNRIRKTLYYGRRTSYQGMAVSRPLAVYASEFFSEPHKGYSLNRLTEEVAGGINASPCALIMALIYLDRLNANDPSYVRRITPSELFIVSLVISTKFYWEIDEQQYLKTCARESNITEERIKELELQFLFAIDWNINISENEFFEKLANVEKAIAQREGIKRGWLTYTELLNLLPSFTIVKFLLNNFAIMAVSYAASVMTIAGAFFLVSHIAAGGGGGVRRGDNNVMSQRNLATAEDSSNSQMISTSDDFDTSSGPSITDANMNLRLIETKQINNNAVLNIDIEEEMKKLELQYNKITETVEKINPNFKSFTNFIEEKLIQKNHFEPKEFPAPSTTSTDCLPYHDLRISNSTKSIFWRFLKEGKNVFIQIPFIWFKFI